MSESKVMSISITKSYVVKTSCISSEKWGIIEEMLVNEEISIDEISESIGIDLEKSCSKTYEATVEDITQHYPKETSF